MAHSPSVSDLGENLRDDVVVRCDLGSEEWAAEELFQSVGDTVEEFENEERLGIVSGGGREEEEVILDYAVQDCWRVERREIQHAGPWGGMLEVEWEEDKGR